MKFFLACIRRLRDRFRLRWSWISARSSCGARNATCSFTVSARSILGSFEILGGVTRQYLNHHHEAMFASAKLGAETIKRLGAKNSES